MRVRFAQAAEDDLDGTIDHIALDSSTAAERVFRAIVTAAYRLAEFPESGPQGRLPDTRELSVTDLPYVIVYQVAAGTVTIIAVFHGARDLARALADRRKALSRP